MMMMIAKINFWQETGFNGVLCDLRPIADVPILRYF